MRHFDRKKVIAEVLMWLAVALIGGVFLMLLWKVA